MQRSGQSSSVRWNLFLTRTVQPVAKNGLGITFRKSRYVRSPPIVHSSAGERPSVTPAPVWTRLSTSPFMPDGDPRHIEGSRFQVSFLASAKKLKRARGFSRYGPER